ncbi:MAG: hypothetical protein Q7I97_06330 [Thermovirgaceae bacterium]|nr:hypothetical protein [Thermovirgaceae bacterium]
MAKKSGLTFGKKALLLIVAFTLACLATYALFVLKVNTKVEAIELVKREYLPKETIDAFVSRTHQESKFKLLGWGIEETGEKGVFIVSYTIRRLNEDGFKIGDPVGYWFKVEPAKGSCEPIRPDGTITPEEREG